MEQIKKDVVVMKEYSYQLIEMFFKHEMISELQP